MEFIKEYSWKKGNTALSGSFEYLTVGAQGVLLAGLLIPNTNVLIKLSPSGNVMWAKDLGGVRIKQAEFLNNGEVIGLGEVDNKPIILKIDLSGNFIWYFTLDITLDNLFFGIKQNLIVQDANGNFVFLVQTGYFSDRYLIKVDNNGNVIQAKSLTAFELGYGQLVYDPYENNFVVLNASLDFGVNNNEDPRFTVVVLDNNLDLVRRRRIRFPNYAVSSGFARDVFLRVTPTTYDFFVLNTGGAEVYDSISKDMPLEDTIAHSFSLGESALGYYYFKEDEVLYVRNGGVDVLKVAQNVTKESFDLVSKSNNVAFEPFAFVNNHYVGKVNTAICVSQLTPQGCINQTSNGTSNINLQQITRNVDRVTYSPINISLPLASTTLQSFTNLTWTIAAVCPPEVPKFLQSPHFYLQAAGSSGADGSAQGIHLRWVLKNQLSNHLPKGDAASTTHNFNRANDFVRIYRAPYEVNPLAIDFNDTPMVVDDANYLWVYQVFFQTFNVYFHNSDKYNEVRLGIDPNENPLGFIQGYGGELIEIENQENVFSSISFTTNNTSTGSLLAIECFGVDANSFSASKSLIARQTFTEANIASAKVVVENGRSVKFNTTNCIITKVEIEQYSIMNERATWQELGEFALTTNDTEAFQRLEPTTGLINGKWPRYNDQTFVDVAAYQDKWSGTRAAPDRNIKEVVQQYLTLSDQVNNPTGVETVQFTTDENESDGLEVSNLDMLQLASFDYHIARMLGLGYLDTDSAVMSGKFIYKAEYITTADLGDGEGAREVQHTYISLPTSVNDERLPIAVDLETPQMGIKYSGNAESQVQLTDDQGYTQDGKTRFITLLAKALPEYNETSFFASNDTFNFASNTFPVFAGIEYKAQGDAGWQRPEILNNSNYLAAVPSGVTPYAESVVLNIPDPGEALYVHREKRNGTHIYSSYGVNWFGRATRSAVEHTVTTTFAIKNPLLPPSGLQALLIQPEKPLLLTSQNDQIRLENNSLADNILVRLNFEYNSFQELVSYKITPEDMGVATDPLDPNAIFPDTDEVFADEVEIFFRSAPPTNIIGKAKPAIVDDPSDPLVAIIRTENYQIVSTGEEWIPTVEADKIANFAGGVLTLENDQYLIKEVLPADNSPAEGPIIKVYKQAITDGVSFATLPNASDDLQAPIIKADGKLMAVENMQNTASWGGNNPHTFKVQIGDNWAIHREQISQQGASSNAEDFVEKSRGIWGTANLETTTDVGVYKVTFDGTQLDNHPQFQANGNSVNWYRGIVRVHLADDVNGKRKNLQVLKIENLGQSADLVLYIIDPDRQQENVNTDFIQTGTEVSVNFYPGYQVHLYADNTWGLNSTNILPAIGEGIRYTIFGTRSVSNTLTSNMSTPQLMFAQEIIVPQQPELPQGGLYATRPDSFGKANYTLTTQFNHSPFALLYLRADEQAILNALYTPETITTIRAAINALQDTAYESNRWQNLLAFDYTYPAGDTINEDDKFGVYPPKAGGYRLPNPDRPELFLTGETSGTLDPGTIKERIQAAVSNAFVPLTEVPLLYQHINNGTYQPMPKKQVIRGRDGQLLKPEDPAFDIAPMAKKTGSNQVLFTDFGLDGTSDNLYFYAVQEMGSTMQLGPFSPILGPVSLVNTKAPEPPQVKSIMPVLANLTFNSGPGMQFEVNAYSQLQHIKRINVYRTLEPTNSLSVRSMDLVKTIELTSNQQSQDSVWVVEDDFSDVEYAPYGEPLYYRLTVDREVTYADKDGNVITDYASSLPSKLLISNIVESTNPEAPKLTYNSSPLGAQFEIANVRLGWQKTTHNGKYHLYKMNAQGNWIKIYEIASNDATMMVDLAITNLQSSELLLRNTEGIGIYHHFKVESENSAGMMSREENILTISATNVEIPDTSIKSETLVVTQNTVGDNFDTGLVNNLEVTENIVVQVNGTFKVLDKNSLSTEAYFSKDGGTTATDDFQGATLYWNTNIAGFALTPDDEVTFFNVYPVDYAQPFPENGDLLHQQLQINVATNGDQFDTGQTCNLAINHQLILEINGRRMLVTKDSLTQAAYFSKDSGTTATDDFNGAILYWNTSIAGFALESDDNIWIFNLYPVDQTLLS
ncbi:hypothetical protein BKI52_37020 [marine bacterium AO1-C]|nr:hypothetical protein BKI52_37020 [marine bacterium AO1-C]